MGSGVLWHRLCSDEASADVPKYDTEYFENVSEYVLPYLHYDLSHLHMRASSLVVGGGGGGAPSSIKYFEHVIIDVGNRTGVYSISDVTSCSQMNTFFSVCS